VPHLARAEPSRLALRVLSALVLAPIALTSEVNGDFSVTFLFWWAAGFAVTTAISKAPTLSSPARGGGVT